MKLAQPRVLWLMVLIISLVGGLQGCAANSPSSAGQTGALIPITKIETRDADGMTEIVIEGAEPILQFTSYQVTEPLRLFIDISDADVRKLQEKISVAKGAVLDIVPSQIDSTGRLEIGLTASVDSKVYQAGGKLIIELAKPAEDVRPSPEAVIAAPLPAAAVVAPGEQAAAGADGESGQKAEKGTASVVTAVRANAGKDGVKVVIAGNGTMVPNTFMLEGKRLVIDILGARSRVRPSVIPVRKGGLDKVRVGQHATPEQKVRIVLDLTRPMTYTATPEGNSVVIAMAPAVAGTPTPEPEEKAPPMAAEKSAVETESAVSPPVSTPPVEPPATSLTVKTDRAMSGSRFDPLSPESALEVAKYSGRRISLDLQDADLINILRLFADVANLNMIVSPEVKGKVTVRMVNIPWDQAMDIILKMNGLGYAIDDNIIRIASAAALTKEAEEESRAKEAKKKAEDLTTRIVSINYTTAKAIESTLKKSLSARGETVVDERTNTIIVKDIARNVEEILTLVRLLDKPIPQIMIEARIVEASANFNRSIGVQWGGQYNANAAHGNSTGLTFPNSVGVTGGGMMGPTASGAGNYIVNMPAATGSGSGASLGISLGSLSKAINLDLVLSALESTGEGKVISTPRVSALDNKEAKIEQGISIPFSTTSSSGTQVQFIDAKLSLVVTPHATPDNKVFLKIQATKNAPDTSLLGASGQPSIRKNEATTEILLGDGETAVIGGILIIDRGETINKVPFFADIPLIGWLFKKKTVREDKRELLIFITPRIVKQEVI